MPEVSGRAGPAARPDQVTPHCSHPDPRTKLSLVWDHLESRNLPHADRDPYCDLRHIVWASRLGGSQASSPTLGTQYMA